MSSASCQRSETSTAFQFSELAPLYGERPVQRDRRHTFVSARDVAQFTAAAVGKQAALNRRLVIGGPNPLSFREAAAVFERVLGREVAVQSIAPGQPIAGLPPVVADIMSGMDLHESIVDMTTLKREFGITLTSVDDFARQPTSSDRCEDIDDAETALAAARPLINTASYSRAGTLRL